MNNMMRIWDSQTRDWLKEPSESLLFMLYVNDVVPVVPHYSFGNIAQRYASLNYIGIDDVYGTPIFEEDIVILRPVDDERESGFGNEMLGVIKYIAPSYVLVCHHNIHNFSPSDEIKVLGTMKSNPEMFIHPGNVAAICSH